ncbi:hypothetical protein AEYBE204_09290 [Asticcacaulis sp. YBE204]|nr:hypothetical protein AEYBE204_09290 [Asticcacaulis sp. YBE204]
MVMMMDRQKVGDRSLIVGDMAQTVPVGVYALSYPPTVGQLLIARNLMFKYLHTCMCGRNARHSYRPNAQHCDERCQ